MDFYILCALAVLVALNLTLTLFLGVFVVRSVDRITSMIGDLASMVMNEPVTPVSSLESAPRAATWDEKFEAEIDAAQRRLRQMTNLADLPTGPTYSIPPATEPTEGMTIVDRE